VHRHRDKEAKKDKVWTGRITKGRKFSKNDYSIREPSTTTKSLKMQTHNNNVHA
jgi:hypothetical protein